MTFAEYIDLARSPHQDDHWRPRSSWVTEPSGLHIYVRTSLMCGGGFEIANLNLAQRKRGRGTFSDFLKVWEDHIPLHIENIMNEQLLFHLGKRPGWITIGHQAYNRLWIGRKLNIVR